MTMSRRPRPSFNGRGVVRISPASDEVTMGHRRRPRSVVVAPILPVVSGQSLPWEQRQP